MRPSYRSLLLSSVLPLIFLSLCSIVSLHAQSAIPPAPQSRIAAPIDDSSLVTLRGNVDPRAQSRYDTGSAASSMPARRLLLVLSRSTQQEANLHTYLESVQNRQSPAYHRFLTPAEFGLRFGVDEPDLATIQKWLSAQGFTIDKVSPGHMLIEFSGTTGQVENAFHTSIHSFSSNGTQYWANTTDPQIPAALSAVIAGVASLNSYRPKAEYILGPRGTFDASTHTIRPAYTLGNASQGYYIFLGPADAATIYDTPTTLNANLSGTTYDGSGVTIGIAGDSSIDVTQNANYRATFGLAANPTTVIVDGEDPGENGDAVEAYLDTQVAGGIAPKANVILYTAADTTYQAGLFLAIQRALDDDQADILNVSFGGCEANYGTAGNRFINDLWEQAAAEGIAVTVASGDSGSAGCDDPNTETEAINGLAVNAIGSTPFNISVGGTDFDVLYSDFPASFTDYVDLSNTFAHHRSAIKYIPEEPWNNSTLLNATIDSNYTTSPDMNIEAGGGGISSVYSMPNWQSSATSGSMRNLPDVSFLAGNGFYGAVWGICTDLEVDSSGNPVPDCAAGATGNSFYLTGVGGTSAASPAFAGMLALAEQKAGSRLGQADYSLYDIAGAAYSSVFHDVTTGDNSVFCSLNSPDCDVISASTYEYYLSGYNATAKYDTASGLGSVDASQMLAAWSSPRFSATSSAFALDGATTPLTITHGQSVSVSDNVTGSGGTPSGEVELVDNLSPATRPNADGIATFPLTNGTLAGATTLLPGGAYQISAHYSGNGTFAQSDSNAISVTVNAESSTTALKVAGVYDPATGKTASTPYYGYIYLLDAQPYGNSASAASPDGVATGTITFNSGSIALGSATLSSEGVAELQTATIPGGSNDLTASFPGDASFQASTSSPLAYAITPAVTALSAPAVTGSGGYYGSDVTLGVKLTVDSAGAAPTGTITFMNGSATVGTTPLLGTAATGSSAAAGTASLTVNNLPRGVNNVTAVYSGDSNYAGSTSSSTQVTVIGNPTTLSFSPAAPTTAVDQPLQFTVTPATASGVPAPTGTITVPGSSISTALVSGSASITIPANTLKIGAYYIEVDYSGDNAYAPLNSGVRIVVNTSGSVTPTLKVTAPASTSDATAGITVALSGPSGDPTPTGTVLVSFPPLPNTLSAQLTNGSASFSGIGLNLGNNTFLVNYFGDSTYGGAATPVTIFRLFPAQITFNPNYATLPAGQAYAVTVTLAQSWGVPAPTGTITLSSGSYTSAVTQLVSGSASFTIPANTLPVGNNTVTASYSGDSNYDPGTATETVVVTSPPPGLSLSSSNLTVTAGATTGNTTAITLTPTNGFTGSVSLAASLTASPANAIHPPTFSFGTTSPVTISGTAAATATLTVSTTAPSTSALSISAISNRAYAAAGAMAFCLLLCGIPARKKQWRWLAASVLLLAILAGGMVACGSAGGNGGGGGGSTIPGTTPGNYTVSITATSGSTSATTTLTLTVQ